jgi:hypothetical protein
MMRLAFAFVLLALVLVHGWNPSAPPQTRHVLSMLLRRSTDAHFHHNPSALFSSSTSIDKPGVAKPKFAVGSEKIPMIVNAYVDGEILRHLQMKNHERKLRILVSRSIDEYSQEELRRIVETKCPSLKGQPYKLRFTLPIEKVPPKSFFNDSHVQDTVTRGYEMRPNGGKSGENVT